MRRSLLAVLMLLAFTESVRADEWFVEAHYPDRAALARAGGHFQHMIVDPVRQTIRLDTDEGGIRFLEQQGLSVQVDMVATASLRAFYQPAEGINSIPGFACYRTVEETYASIDTMEQAYPQLAVSTDIGPSWEKSQNTSAGYQMRALRITNLATAASDPDRPRMVMFGSIHAREYTPAELLTRLAEWLVTGYGIDAQATWLVDNVDFRFILQANPDGRKMAEAGDLWRKNTNDSNGACTQFWEAPGIDLNRNFPFHWGAAKDGTGSSPFPCDETYRGPSAGSEPETQNLVSYVAGTPGMGGVYSGGALPDQREDGVNITAPSDYPGMFFDIHSYSRLVVWPWGDTSNLSPNATQFQTLGRRIAWFNNYTPAQASDPNFLYTTDGTTDDTFYGLLGAPSLTIELGTSFFESCNSFQNSTLPLNLAALKYAARIARAPYQLSLGPDVHGLSLNPDKVASGFPAQITATINDTRYNTMNGSQAPFQIQGAEVWVDAYPGTLGSTPIAMQAVDGAFDSALETVQAVIPTAGLSLGKHLIYLQGRNVADGGTLGAADAVFLEVRDAEYIFEDDFE